MDAQCMCKWCHNFGQRFDSAESNLRKRAKTYIHVNRQRMMSNRKNNTDLPVVAVRRGRSGKPKYFRQVTIEGPSRVIYDPVHALCTGAQVWIEVDAGVTVKGEE